MPYHGSDIGGFYGSEQPSAELYVRWLQAAVFTSHMRVHGIGEREPWAFGAEAEGDRAQMARVPLPADSLPRAVIAQATRTGLPVMRAMPLAFPDNALTRDYETQFMCGDALLVAPIVRDRRRGRHRASAGRLVRPQYARSAIAGSAGDALSRRSSTSFRCSAAKATRCRSAAPCSTPAKSTRDKPLELLWVFGKPAQPRRRLSRRRASTSDRNGACTVRAALDVDVEVFGDAPASIDAAATLEPRWPRIRRIADHVRRTRRGSAPSWSRCSPQRTPSGRSRRGSCVARRSRRCSPPARRASARRRATLATIRSRPRRSAASIEVWHHPLAAPVDARAARSGERATACSSMLRAGCDACATGAFAALVTAPVQKSAIDGRRHPVHRPHRVPRRAHAHAARRDDAASARGERRCASRSPPRTCRLRDVPRRSRRRRSTRRSRSSHASCARVSASPSRASPCAGSIRTPAKAAISGARRST